GHLDQLKAAHARIGEDRAAYGAGPATVIHIGDVCDRGPDTKGVIQFLLDGMAEGEDWLVIRGNHDQMFLDFLSGGDGTNARLGRGVTWQHHQMGGRATLASYGAKKSMLESDDKFRRRARKAIPSAHAEFLADLPYWYRAEDMIFVHAGIRPGFPLEAQDEADLLWIRDDFLWHLADHEALIVHGHTPVDEPTHYGNRVNIDTGAGWGNALIPVVFDDGKCFALRAEGRELLKVPRHRPKTVLRR
ncbi:MAG: metallophosphoesterase, partial [Alphaproteobacteria bacterium]|nr:metallophosphoesterase [Alphaproteobacteria bacterium]